jgi:hypothetical protein
MVERPVAAYTRYEDRREHPREVVNLRARALYGPKRELWADCTIVDLSKGGAKLQISEIYPLPGRFRLMQVKGGIVYEARLRWRRGDLTGVAFDDQKTIEGATDAEILALEPTWRSLLAGA